MACEPGGCAPPHDPPDRADLRPHPDPRLSRRSSSADPSTRIRRRGPVAPRRVHAPDRDLPVALRAALGPSAARGVSGRDGLRALLYLGALRRRTSCSAGRTPCSRCGSSTALPTGSRRGTSHPNPNPSPRSSYSRWIGVFSAAMRRAAFLLLVVFVGLAWSAPASAGYKAKIAGGTLTLTGNSKGDKLVLRLKKGSNGTLQADVGANGTADFSFARKRFTKIVVNAGGGADAVTISDKNGAFTTQETTRLNGGPGNDKLTGGAGAETLAGGPGTDIAAGGGGSDVFLWNPGDGSDKVDGAGGTDALSVNGTAGNDTVQVNPNAARILVSGAGAVLDVGTVESLDVNTLGGDDTISAGAVAALTALDFDGGDGNDTLNGGDGKRPAERRGRRRHRRRKRRRGRAFLGDGNDTFVWDPGDGSDVVEGEAGFDTMRFNGSAGAEIFAASANGSRLLFTRNLGNIVMDIDDVETLTSTPLGGADTATVSDLAGTDMTIVNVDLGVSGAPATRQPIGSPSRARQRERHPGHRGRSATVQVIGLAAQVNVSSSEAANDRLDGHGLGGNDTLSARRASRRSIAAHARRRRRQRHPQRRQRRRHAARRRRQRHGRRQRGQRHRVPGRRQRHVRLGSRRRQRHRRGAGRDGHAALQRLRGRRDLRRLGERRPAAVHPQRRRHRHGHRRRRDARSERARRHRHRHASTDLAATDVRDSQRRPRSPRRGRCGGGRGLGERDGRRGCLQPRREPGLGHARRSGLHARDFAYRACSTR